MKILSIGHLVKTNPIQSQSNPKQTQYKPNSRKGKIDAKCVFTKDYEKNADRSYEKTKPIQTQFAKCSNEHKFYFNKGLGKK